MKFTRSVSVDIFFKEERQRQYDRHLQKITEIKEHRDSNRKIVKEAKKMTEKLHKARQRARSFKKKEDAYHRSLENQKMASHLSGMQPMIQLNQKSHQTVMMKVNGIRNNSPTPFISQRNNHYPTIRDYLVEKDNKKLADGIKSQEVNLKDYKKKLATEVGQYIKLRQHMQRFKTIREEGSSFSKSGRSQLKILNTERSDRSIGSEDSQKSQKSLQKEIDVGRKLSRISRKRSKIRINRQKIENVGLQQPEPGSNPVSQFYS